MQAYVVEDIEIGRCEGCKQVVYDVNNMTEQIKTKMKDYDIRAVPTTIIDGKIRIVGIPDFLQIQEQLTPFLWPVISRKTRSGRI